MNESLAHGADESISPFPLNEAAPARCPPSREASLRRLVLELEAEAERLSRLADAYGGAVGSGYGNRALGITTCTTAIRCAFPELFTPAPAAAHKED